MSELHEMNEHLQSIDKRLDRHIGVVEVILKNQQTFMETLRSDIKDQKGQFLAYIETVTGAVDTRITSLKEDMSDKYYDKHTIDVIHYEATGTQSDKRRAEITTAVSRLEDDIDGKLSSLESKGQIFAGVTVTVITLVLLVMEVIGVTG